MALTKTTTEDRIEVVGDFKLVHLRTATVIKEDGTELSRSFHRKSLNPGELNGAKDALVDTDLSSESAEVRGIATSVWTTDVKNAWKTKLIAEENDTGS